MSMDAWINVSAVWRIVVVSLLAGAGLPALFAVGIRALATEGRSAPRSPARSGLAVTCFALVLAGVGLGIAAIVSGG